MITCLVLGSGGAVPTPTRTPAGYWTVIDGRPLLVDPGPGTLVRLIGAPEGPDSLDAVDAVLFSHLHPDHCVDLQTLLFALHVPASPCERTLQLIGPAGLARHLAALHELWGDWMTTRRRPVEVIELEPGEVLAAPEGDRPWRRGAGDDAGATAFAASHDEGRFCATCLGYRFRDAQGHTLVYSGDSGPCPSLTDAARGCDLLLVECSLPDGAGAVGHMSPSSVGRLCRDADPGRVALTHIYPETDALDLEGIVGELWSGPVVRAADGMLLSIPSPASPTPAKDTA